MEYSQIKYLLTVAETLNFTKAAEKCGVTQPALSRGIRKLEEELGAQLIRRERGRTHLTELGERLLPRLAQSVSLAEAAKTEAKDFADMAKATLALGVMCTIGPARLIALVDHLTAKVPELELCLFERSAPTTVYDLLEGKFDVALAALPEYPDEVLATPLYEERYLIAFPKGHRFEKMDTVPRSELAGERYLQRINCEYPAHVEHVTGPYALELDIPYQSEHEDWLQAMVVAGLGCCVIPEHMQIFPELQTRLLTEPEISRTISLVTVRGRPHTPVVAMFQRLTKAALSSVACRPEPTSSAATDNS